MASPDIIVYFLAASRAIRIPWLLEELNLPYTLVISPRSAAGVAPDDFKAKIPAPLKKSPTIKDGDLVIQESGAIAEYLCEKYDTQHKLLPTDLRTRAAALEWLHAAEGTFALHALAILYMRWRTPEAAKQYVPEIEAGMSGNVQNDLNWLEGTLKEQKDKGHSYLVGNDLTVADVMMGFTVEFILARKLGTGDKSWPEAEAWLKRIMDRPAYKTAVQKSGYSL